MRQLLTLVLVIANSALAADWPQFRGVNGLGVSADKNLPVQFGPVQLQGEGLAHVPIMATQGRPGQREFAPR